MGEKIYKLAIWKLEFFRGKKGSIASILMGIVAYCATKGYIAEAEVALATIISVALFGSASIMTGRLVAGKNVFTGKKKK